MVGDGTLSTFLQVGKVRLSNVVKLHCVSYRVQSTGEIRQDGGSVIETQNVSFMVWAGRDPEGLHPSAAVGHLFRLGESQEGSYNNKEMGEQ